MLQLPVLRDRALLRVFCKCLERGLQVLIEGFAGDCELATACAYSKFVEQQSAVVTVPLSG